MVETNAINLIIQLRIDYYDRCIFGCLEALADNNPQGDELLLLREQRILYTMFRDDLVKIKNALR